MASRTVLHEDAVKLSRLKEIAREISACLRPGDLVLLYGPLGAGKTEFVRAVCEALGVTDSVRSPSFTIANIYAGPLRVHHLDLYRLDEMCDEDSLALEEYLRDDTVTFVEWPQAGTATLSRPDWVIILDHRSLEERSIRVETSSGRLCGFEGECRPGE